MKQRTIDICKIALCIGYQHNLSLKKKIAEWDNPEDSATRVAQMLITDNNFYANVILAILSDIDTKCKHPKKMQDVCGKVRYCMNCNLDLEKIKKPVKKKTRSK